MGLTADIGLRGIILSVERVEVLIEAGISRDARIDSGRLKRSTAKLVKCPIRWSLAGWFLLMKFRVARTSAAQIQGSTPWA